MSENIAGLLTDDSRIFHRKDCAYDWVDKATGAAFRGNVMTVDLALESGKPMTLSVEAIWRARARAAPTCPGAPGQSCSIRSAFTKGPACS